MLADGASLADVEPAIRAALRKELSPRHVPDRFVLVDEVPRTLSGKKCEVPVKRILAGVDPAKAVSSGALRNPDALAPFLELAGAPENWRAVTPLAGSRTPTATGAPRTTAVTVRPGVRQPGRGCDDTTTWGGTVVIAIVARCVRSIADRACPRRSINAPDTRTTITTRGPPTPGRVRRRVPTGAPGSPRSVRRAGLGEIGGRERPSMAKASR